MCLQMNAIELLIGFIFLPINTYIYILFGEKTWKQENEKNVQTKNKLLVCFYVITIRSIYIEEKCQKITTIN